MQSLEFRVWARQDKPKHPWVLVATFRDSHDATEYRDRTEADIYRVVTRWQLLITKTEADPNTFAQYGHTAAWALDIAHDRQDRAEEPTL